MNRIQNKNVCLQNVYIYVYINRNKSMYIFKKHFFIYIKYIYDINIYYM